LVFKYCGRIAINIKIDFIFIFMEEDRIITGIGSLPFESVENAISYSWKHDIPFLPELTKRNETMFEYIENPGSLLCLDYFKGRKYESVKIQCVGPATLIERGYNESVAVKRAHEHLSKILDVLEADEKIVFLDEPVLGKTNLDYKALWEILFYDLDVVSGIHTCGEANWDELFDSNVDIISFDASKYNIAGRRNGKRIAWGVEKLEDVKDFQEGDLLTLPCGMSHFKYEIDDCEKNLEKLVGMKKLIEARNV
jgi:hypothetical protein